MDKPGETTRLTKDAEWRKKFYKHLDPNQAVGISESIVALLLTFITSDNFPIDDWIHLASNWSLKITSDGDKIFATLYPVYKGVVEEEHGVWNWKG